MAYSNPMSWQINFDDMFFEEARLFEKNVKIEMAAMLKLLSEFGPNLKRPHCDTLKSSKFSNLKELRFVANDGVWRLAFAFDPNREAILLVAGDKSGVNQKRFYKNFISTAEQRYRVHLEKLGKGA